MADDLDDRVDALYALPLNEFVAARNALAKDLKQPELKRLQKPTSTAWVLNQLARRFGEEMDEFLEAGRRVAETQAGAVRGRGSAPFREAVHAEREALNPLLARTRKLVKSESQVAKVADGLRAAAADAAVGEALRLGRLSQEPESSGFGGLTASDELAAADGQTVEDAAAAREAEARARVERERKQAQQLREDAERDAARLESKLDEAEQRATQLRAEAEDAKRRATEAARRLEELPE